MREIDIQNANQELEELRPVKLNFMKLNFRFQELQDEFQALKNRHEEQLIKFTGLEQTLKQMERERQTNHERIMELTQSMHYRTQQ